MRPPDIEDLQFFVYKLKKENLDLRNENQIQKVKIRKLTDEVNKLNRQLDGILDPKKNNIAKLLSRHGAQLISNLKQENFSLYKKLGEKDLQLKKIQTELETTRLYVNEKARVTSPSLRLLQQQELLNKVGELNKKGLYKAYTDRPNTRTRSKSLNARNRSRSMTPSLQDSTSTTNTERNYMEMINSNLQKIKQSGSFQGERPSQLTNKNEMPHEEIQQLQTYLINVLTEVDSLKHTINALRKEQTGIPIIRGSNRTQEQQTKGSTDPEEAKEYETEFTETMSKDSSKNTSYASSAESEYNDTTDASTSEVKSSRKMRCTGGQPCCMKSICVQTARSFCSRAFTPAPVQEGTSTTVDNEENVDEYDLEVEFIN